MIEINPLCLMQDGSWCAVDAKIVLEDHALFRQPHLAELRDLAEEDPTEVEAGRVGLNYVKLDGNIGCMVNGAGLAMATMDIIKLEGGEPANFLDVGGGASADAVAAAFRIITSDPAVTAILINVFGGIVKCDVVAEGILMAVQQTGVSLPLVVRLQGTNADEGLAILRESGMAILTAADLGEAARKVVAAVRGGEERR